jgi:putative chitinase
MTPDRLPPEAAPYLDAMNAAMNEFGIDSPLAQAAFVAQMLHESANFTRMEEGLNYSAGGLMRTWPSHFDSDTAMRVGRTASHAAIPVAIANIAYASRMGNGDVDSGDGWRYRGRGPGQLTGADNYAACGDALGLDLVGNPDLVADPAIGCQAFGWFWNKHHLSALADAGRIDDISRAVNGGALGLVERRELTEALAA